MEGWEHVSIEATCEILDRIRKPITKKDRIAGPYPYYGATGVLDHVEGYLFDEPLVLIGEDGAKWESGDNTAFPIDGKCWVNNHAHVLRPNREILLDSWLIYYLNHSDLTPFITGLTVPKLNQGKLKQIPIPLPPLPEQERIVAILDEAFAAIETATAHTEKNLANARELFESQLQALLNPGDTVMEGWEQKTISAVAYIVSGQHILARDYNTSGEGIGYLTGPSDFGETYPSVSKWTSSPKAIAIDGDVLVTVKGSGVGKANLSLEVDLAISRQLMAIRSEGVASRFLYLFLLSQFELLQEIATGAAIPGLSRSQIGSLPLPLPPLPEQERIVANLDAASEKSQQLCDAYDLNLEHLSNLKQSLLQKAFTGELTSDKKAADCTLSEAGL